MSAHILVPYGEVFDISNTFRMSKETEKQPRCFSVTRSKYFATQKPLLFEL